MKKRTKHNITDGQLSLFDLDLFPFVTETIEEQIQALRHKDVYHYRTKTIKSGNVLECEIYPIWKTQEAKRAKKTKPSRKAQENLNHKNTKKKIMRLTNTNFDGGDIWGTFGYDDENLPKSPEQAHKDIINFLRRIKNYRNKQGLPDIRYIYVTEYNNNNEEDKVIRCHHHLVMSGDMDRDVIERLWKGGAYPQTRRLRVKDDCGLNGLGAYLAKGSKGEKMWGHSINLKQPKVTVSDCKINIRRAENIVIDQSAVPAYFEKLYKDYFFKHVETKRSDFVAGVYIYVQMYSKQPPTRNRR